MNTSNLLSINSLVLELYLGWPDDERLRKQTVLLDIQFQFANTPKACTTDHLDDTFCYRHFIEKLRADYQHKKCHLIEFVAHDIYQLLKTLTPPDTKLSVTLTKQPLIAALGSVSFKIGDFS